MCHVAAANGQIVATDDQLAIAYENATTAQAIGYTPMVAIAVPLLGLSSLDAVGVYTFGNLGKNPHLGLELANKMNIIQIGYSSIKGRGWHIAFGATEPMKANIHIYLQSAFPFFRIWP